MPEFSEADINALGNRLRHRVTAADRAEIRTYLAFLNSVRLILQEELRGLFPITAVASRTKRAETVIAKLRRRSELELSQMPDIAGCRIIVSSRAEQEAVVSQLTRAYDVRQLDDKTDNPKFGYRAVHLDIQYQGVLAEIQVQTLNQHRWQRVSEEAAGYDISIKYGGGRPEVGQVLLELSQLALQCDLTGADLPEDAIQQTLAVIHSSLNRPSEGREK